MKVSETRLPGVRIIEPRVFDDERGFFLEAWNGRDYEAAGMAARFVQDNHSRSAKSVLRGLHYQVRRPQGKLVRVVTGSAYTVAVDLRRSSDHFGRWFGIILSGKNMRQLWIPPEFAHGFLTLEDDTDYLYKCTDYYAPEYERTILYSDPALGIAWPLDGREPLLAPRDARAPHLVDAETFD
jgi:dTDP-4-dehydrorhamnose 3,5-epimerase